MFGRRILSLLFFCLFTSVIHAQTTSSTDSSPTTTTGENSSQTTQTNTQSTRSSTQSNTQSNTQSGASTTDGSSAQSATNSQSSTTSISVNPVDPPGGVSMLTPALSQQSSIYYKIGGTVSLSWSYTSVQVTPSAVAIEAYCATNKFYYPVADNLSFNQTSFVWDTEAYDANTTQPLITAMYTLYIFDESRSVTAIPSAGFLGAWNGYVFGMYSPQPYTPLPSNTCVICSGAPGMLAKGIWWTILLAAAFAVGGWAVIA